FIKEVVIGYAIPKIKGKITNGKLKWRGIVVNMTRDYPKKIWITQRGRKLYKSLVLDRNYTISEPIGNINIKNGEICKLEEITIN
ncbi:hypothetical protein KAH94_04660, partial [bacterium]|nr:hypothetical protein [bacterium]